MSSSTAINVFVCVCCVDAETENTIGQHFGYYTQSPRMKKMEHFAKTHIFHRQRREER